MVRQGRRLGCVCLSVALLLGVWRSSRATAGGPDPAIDAGAVDAAQRRLDNRKGAGPTVEDRLAKLEARVSALADTLDEANLRVEQMRAALAATRQELAAARAAPAPSPAGDWPAGDRAAVDAERSRADRAEQAQREQAARANRDQSSRDQADRDRTREADRHRREADARDARRRAKASDVERLARQIRSAQSFLDLAERSTHPDRSDLARRRTEIQRLQSDLNHAQAEYDAVR